MNGSGKGRGYSGGSDRDCPQPEKGHQKKALGLHHVARGRAVADGSCSPIDRSRPLLLPWQRKLTSLSSPRYLRPHRSALSRCAGTSSTNGDDPDCLPCTVYSGHPVPRLSPSPPQVPVPVREPMVSPLVLFPRICFLFCCRSSLFLSLVLYLSPPFSFCASAPLRTLAAIAQSFLCFIQQSNPGREKNCVD